MEHMMYDSDIRFPNLGIVFENLKNYISILNFPIMYYGVLIAIGAILAFLLVEKMAKKTGQDPEKYFDLELLALFIGAIGARIYYVVFNFDEYKNNLLQIFNIRRGGLAIYGGVIFGVATAYIYCKKKKMNIPLVFDTGILGLLVGQIIGRWGNFFNREVFGCYTNSLFAMQIDVTDAPYDFQCSVADLQAR
ncbi:MAG: prolipoprotein diacylglyceryl transferase, partial [Lachnospiraceae bacterium]|nr:prolipoprotein diacylglyceryl transferase [Lachnospiraceae bacterium]